MRERTARGVAVAAGVALSLVGAAPAGAHADRQSVGFSLTTTQPGAATGSALRVEFRNPADPNGKPYALAQMIIRLAPGSVIDTSALPQCRASDLALMLQGAPACPPGSRVGGGSIVTETGLPEPARFGVNTLTTFNNRDELIGLAESTNPPTRVVSRSPISGTRITVNVPLVPGLPPPDPYLAFKRFVTITPALVRAGRAYARTPPSCPASGYWSGSIGFGYRDGVTQTVPTRAPCQRG